MRRQELLDGAFQLALLTAGKVRHLFGVGRFKLDGVEGLKHRVMEAGGQLGTLLETCLFRLGVDQLRLRL